MFACISVERSDAARGFTLIELLVVIAIIGLLSSVVFASLNTARTKAGNAARLSEIREYETALAAYFADHGEYPQIGSDSIACLGKNPGGTCSNGRYSDSTTLQNALAPYISSSAIPPPNMSYDTIGGFIYFNCPFTGTCTQGGYGIMWYQDGADQSCAPGTVLQNFEKATSCMLFR